VAEHAVILNIPLSGEAFGTEDERGRMRAFGDALEARIDAANVGEFDGHEFGEGQCVLYMYGPDADALFAVVAAAAADEGLPHGSVATKRYGEASDPEAREESVSIGDAQRPIRAGDRGHMPYRQSAGDQRRLALSIGAVEGGSFGWERQWNEGLRNVVEWSVVSQQQDVNSPVRLNVIFHVPGTLGSPDFEGTRTGSYLNKENLLIVQVAVPPEEPADLHGYLRTALFEALDEAERWAERRKITGGFTALRELVESF
jgi:hypothetical protein